MDARRGVALSLALAALVIAGSARAAAFKAEECLGCHADKELTKQVKGKSVSLFTDQALLKGSVHGGLECTACHAGIRELPHPETLPAPTCGRCHDPAQTAFRQGVHGREGGAGLGCQDCHGSHDVKPAAALGTEVCATCHADAVQGYRESAHAQALGRGVKGAADCRSCHGPAHALKSQQEPEAPTSRKRVAATCGACHTDKPLLEKGGIPVPQAFQLYQKSVHARAVAEGKAGATCHDCHGSHRLLATADPKSSVSRGKIPATCASCHRAEGELFAGSVHGTAVARGNLRSPVCSDCHGEHAVPSTQDPASRVSRSAVSKSCGSCHDSLALTERFGLPADRVSSYRDSFHGLAARGGNPTVANCASCHGTHDIRPSSDPRSSIHPARLPQTCGTCHPGAGENFAKGPVHVVVSREQNAILYYAEKLYLLLIVLTIGGMGAHNGLDFFRKLRREYRRRGGASAAPPAAEGERPEGERQRWYLRMSGFERIQHALLASSFLVLVYSGFALTYPETWLFRGFATLGRGYALRGWIHRGAALAMLLACLLHLIYLPTRRGRRFFLDMLPRPSDIREGLQQVGYLLGLRAEPARFDRFGYVEKAEYWALIWGAAIMAVTGLALWFETTTLRVLPLWTLDLATLIHFYEALLATLAILVWHLYYVIFNPDVYPMNWAWLTGKISETMMRHEHPRELERLQAEERAAEEAAERKGDGPPPA